MYLPSISMYCSYSKDFAEVCVNFESEGYEVFVLWSPHNSEVQTWYSSTEF